MHRLAILLPILALAACSPYDPGQRAVAGGLIGGAYGAGIGAVATGGPGAPLGAVVGFGAGALIGAFTTPYPYAPPRYGYGYGGYYGRPPPPPPSYYQPYGYNYGY